MNLYPVGSGCMPVQLSHGWKNLITTYACTLMDGIIHVEPMKFQDCKLYTNWAAMLTLETVST